MDDATNRVWAQFFLEETTRASGDVSEGWVRRDGLPRNLYVVRDSIYAFFQTDAGKRKFGIGEAY